tara:strand:+ start:4713 stop:6479 length:1767 start_codon:yes stop_codon:yes gene_type:complete
MARYDYEGQFDFVKKQFDDAQERGEKTGKRMAREALKQQFVGGVIGAGIKGVKSLLDQKADALHFSQAPQRARYEQMLNQRTSIQNTLKPYIAQGGNKEDYLTNYYYDIYSKEAKIAKPNAVESSYDTWLREEANKKAKSMIPMFDKMQQEAVDVPSFEEFQEQYAKYSGQITPRSLGGAAVKYVKNLFAKETDETLAYKNEKAKDVLYGTSLFKESKELKGALQEWNAAGNGVVDIVKALNAKAESGEIIFKDIVDPKVVEWEELSHGSTIKKKGLLYITRDGKGNKIETVKDLDLNQYEKKTIPVFTESDKKASFNVSKSVVSSFDKKDPRVKIFNKAIEDTTLGLTFGSQILEVTTNMGTGRNTRDVTAQQMAATFLLNQAVEKGSLVGLRTTITNWDISKLSPVEPEKETEYLKNELLPNIKTFKEDIQSKLGANHPEVYNVYKTTLNFIKADSMNLTMDERQEYIRDLNKEYGYETSRNQITFEDDENKENRMPPKVVKKAISIGDVSSKYKIDEELINKLIEMKPKIGGVTQQAPGRIDPIDLITDEMLYNSGYISEGKDASGFKMIGRRRFIRDFYKDLQL